MDLSKLTNSMRILASHVNAYQKVSDQEKVLNSLWMAHSVY